MRPSLRAGAADLRDDDAARLRGVLSCERRTADRPPRSAPARVSRLRPVGAPRPATTYRFRSNRDRIAWRHSDVLLHAEHWTLSLLHQISGCENAARKADVIFIHGLGGNAFGTWCDGKDTAASWPYWLGDEFPDVGIWSLGYAASPTKWTRCFGWLSKRWREAGHSMPLPDRALQVLDLMLLRGLGGRPILFICHSLGGLVAKQILRKSADAIDPRKNRVAGQVRAILFLATPHAGAELASLLNRFRAVFGATVSVEDLRAHDAHLRDLYDWYRTHAPVLGIETVTYYETWDIKGVRVVNPTSADPGVGASPVGLDETHLSIAKPCSRDAQVCHAARDLLNSKVLLTALTPFTPYPTNSLQEPTGHESFGATRAASMLRLKEVERRDQRSPDVQSDGDLLRAVIDENKRLKDENERLRVHDAELSELRHKVEAVQQLLAMRDEP
jgi:pimeloyl-ACP methyl ester carboxylesterase